MKNAGLDHLTIKQLVDRFVSVCVEQDEALSRHEISKYNRIYDKMAGIREELRNREGDGRRSLFSLFSHENRQVRLQAARASFALDSLRARAVLEELASSGLQPQALDAGMTLDNLDEGVFIPT